MTSKPQGTHDRRDLLDGWKEIAGYIGKETRTCRRWEKDHAMPVHRVDSSSSRSKVFAYRSEIDGWLKDRRNTPWPSLKRQVLPGSRLIAAGIILGAFLISATLIILQLSGRKHRSPRNGSSMVVLPIVKPSASEDLGPYYTEGLVNGIRDGIGRSGGVRILPPLSSEDPFSSGLVLPTDSAGNAVDYVLKLDSIPGPEGLRFLVRVYSAADRELVLDREYLGRPDEYFRVRNDICRELINLAGTEYRPTLPVDSIRSPEDPGEGPRPDAMALPPSNDSSRDIQTQLDQARYYAKRYDRKSNERASQLLGSVIQTDPDFAPAYLELARCYINNVNLGWNPNSIWLDTAESLLDRAQVLQPEQADFYALHSQILLLREVAFGEDTKEQALAVALQGLKNHPHHRELHSHLGYYHYLKFAETGREENLDLAFDHKQKAFWADPDDLQNITFLEILIFRKQFDAALELGGMMARNDISGIARFRLGEIYYYMDNPIFSRRIFEEISQSDKDLDLRIDASLYLGMIFARLGRTEEARRITQMIRDGSLDISVLEARFKIASIYFGIGSREAGYDALESFLSEDTHRRRRHLYLQYIELDRNFDSVRNEPRFINIAYHKENQLD